MKKLIAMIGAVAMAFGLYAEDATPASNYYANSFEVQAEGVTDKTWSPEDAKWVTEQTDPFALGDQDQTGLPYYTGAARRNNLFKGDTINLNYLKLETGTNTLARGIDADQVYFDQLVKFTGYEEDPTIANGTKIAVWLSAIDEEDYVPAELDEGGNVTKEASGVQGSTNLFVTVGTGLETIKVQIDPASVGLTEFAVDTWYRITIKSLGDVIENKTDYDIVNQIGFAIFINGKQAAIVDKQAYHAKSGAFSAAAKALYDNGKLFTAIDTSNATLAKVAYQGIGGVDDIIFSQEAPDFDSKVEFDVLPVTGVVIGNVEGPEGVLTKPYMVMPGSKVKIYITAADGYRLDLNPPVITKTITAAGEVSIADELAGKVIEGYAKITREGKDPIIVGQSELDDAIALVEDGDTVTFLKQCTLLNGAYTIPADTTVEVAAGGVWTVNVPANGRLIDTFGVESDKNITITLGDRAGLQLSGTIYSGLKSETSLTVNGAVQLGGALTIGAVKDGAQSDKGAVLATTSIRIAGANKITLEGKGKVISGTELKAENFTNEDVEITQDTEAGTWTAQIKQATGFAIILADGTTTYYNSLDEAIEAYTYEEGAKVALLADCVLDHCVEIAKKVVLDIGEFDITADPNAIASDGEGAYRFKVSPKDALIGVNYNGDLTIVGTTGAIDASEAGIYAAVTMTTLNDKGGIGSKAPATLTVNSGTLKGYYYAVVGNGGRSGTSITINGGTIEGVAVNDSVGIYHPQGGTLTINGGTIKGDTGLYIKAGDCICSVGSGATIIATGTKKDYKASTNGFQSTGDAFLVDNAGYPSGAPMPDIKGGSFVSANGAAVASYAKTGKEPIANFVTGGTFTGAVKIDDAIAGGTYAFGPFVAGQPQTMVDAVAKIGNVNYGTLADAVAAAVEGDTVTLIADATDAAVVNKAVAFTLDLNELTLTMKDGEMAAIKVNNAAAEVTIEGGAIEVPAGAGFCVWARQGNVVIDGVEFTNDSNDDYCVYAGGGVSPDFLESKVTINGGVFINKNKEGYKYNPALSSLALNVQNGGKGVIEVKGGSFSADPAGGDDSTVPATFVADGYKSVANASTGLWDVRALEKYAITIGEIANATLTIDGEAAEDFEAIEDQEYTLTVTAAEGYNTPVITFNGKSIDAGAYTFTEAGTLAASAEAITYNITYTFTGVADADKDNIKNDNPTTFTVEDAITFKAAECEGYEFKGFEPASITKGTTVDQTIVGTFEKKSTDPIDDPSALDDDGEANLAALKDALPLGTDIKAWAASVYADGKIPAAKLNASSAELIAAAATYNLKVMASPVEIKATGSDADGFTFTITDKGGDSPIVAATRAQQMMVYTKDLTVDFSRDVEKKAVEAAVAGETIKVKFTGDDLTGAAAAAGFMKIDLSKDIH